ncbi:MAG: hypothetical protein BMS9Abin19_1018 [Gammaproteobacteria bacterium]|nr:MAG: hypothetical protein BMS9Abin19_1018 [Gammaproteobacteria bacterium]
MRDRRSTYDITDDVQLTYADSVSEAVCTIFRNAFNQFNEAALKQAFEDCERLFEGDYSTFLPCDTLYHDKQHSMDMTLALARLINGHERSVAKDERLGAERAVIAVITALYHDSGYMRHEHDHHHYNGAEYTQIHVSRSADFLKRYLHKINLGKFSQLAANMVHYTGYEIAPEQIRLPDEKWHLIGQMLGTADLIAQMSDRCYLEKCRDRLYPEFVLGGLTVTVDEHGNEIVLYESGEDLLMKTPYFYENEVDNRLNKLFNKVYSYEIAHFEGEKHYINGLGRNQARLKKVLEANDFSMLRRKPPQNYGTKNFPGLEDYLNQHPLKKLNTVNNN